MVLMYLQTQFQKEILESFLDKVWGIKMKSEETSEEEIVTKKRGRKPKAVTN